MDSLLGWLSIDIAVVLNISQEFLEMNFKFRDEVSVLNAGKATLHPEPLHCLSQDRHSGPGWGGRQVSVAAAEGGVIWRPAEGSETNQCGINSSVC